MTRRLFWKLCLMIATTVVAFFYLISVLTSETEDGMSYLAEHDKQTISQWGAEAERLYLQGDKLALNQWLENLRKKENTWLAIAGYEINHFAGEPLNVNSYYADGHFLGRSIDWKIHLYFAENPVMSIPFANKQVGFLIKLPDRMRPGTYWRHTKLTLQLVLPTILLIFLSLLLYRYIMKPMLQLQLATAHFSKGNFDVRAKKIMGVRNDEFSDLADTFDQMASRIGDQIISQRQLIADLSHELRTPLTRLDIALGVEKDSRENSENIERIARESKNIRKLVEDALTLAWLENEQPELQQESVELIDLLDVLVEDARFEFPDRKIVCQFPDSALIEKSSHRAAGQALENVLRNALRYTPIGKTVYVSVEEKQKTFQVNIVDQGPGVPNQYLNTIFKPFFRVDKSREASGNSFGLGLALAQRQLAAIRASIVANNLDSGGLRMTIELPTN